MMMEPVFSPLNENDLKGQNMSLLIAPDAKCPVLMYRMCSCHTMKGWAHAVKAWI